MAGIRICRKETRREHAGAKLPAGVGLCELVGWGSNLELVEAEREMQDLGELLGEGLLLLQVLSGSVRRAGQRLQQALQGFLCAAGRRERR